MLIALLCLTSVFLATSCRDTADGTTTTTVDGGGTDTTECQHVEIIIHGKNADCTSTGISDGKKCSKCGVILEEQKVIPALGHTEAVDSKKDATCTEDGLTEGKRCLICKEKTVKQEIIPAKGHAYGEWVAPVEATKSQDGNIGHYHCSACDKYFDADKKEKCLIKEKKKEIKIYTAIS